VSEAWLKAIGLLVLLGLGYAVAVLRTIAPLTKTKRDNRWAVWLGNFQLWLITTGAKLRGVLDLHKRKK
jgi:hypothetical protein